MKNWADAIKDNWVFVTAIVTGVVALIVATVVSIPKMEKAKIVKLLFSCGCILIAVFLFLFMIYILYDAANPKIPDVIGMLKDKAEEILRAS